MVEREKLKPVPSSAKRLRCQEYIAHQISGEEPIGFNHQWSVQLESDEQPYTRPQLKLTNQWVPLDTGWLGNNVSVVCLINSVKSGKVELSFRDGCGTDLVIPPGLSVRISPHDVSRVRIRAGAGANAKITLHVFPG